MRMRLLLCVCLALCGALSEGAVTLQPGASIILPDRNNAFRFNAGTADKAAYDDQENFLYVIGHEEAIMHVIDMTTPASPRRVSVKMFDKVNDGLPNFVKVCRGSTESFLVVSFEAFGRDDRGHIFFYDLLDSTTVDGPLKQNKEHTTTETYDPGAIAWDSSCKQLLVASQGKAHQLSGVFEDPAADLEILKPDVGSSVIREDIPLSETAAQQANFRHVFRACDSGSSASHRSSLLQSMQPSSVHVDKNNMAYIVFQDSNGIAKLNLNDLSVPMTYHSLGTKDWTGLTFDGSYDDGGIHLVSRYLRSFYQPRDVASFELDGNVYLATADTGSIRTYTMSTCRFAESSVASLWRKPFSNGMPPNEIEKLRQEMAANNDIGRLQVSKLEITTDGWDNTYQGYDYVSMYGGRGFSILDATTMNRVFDSGDQFEKYFESSDASDSERSIFNANLGTNINAAQSSEFDRRSPFMGPEPSAIATGELDSSTRVVVVANGVVGGLYVYSVSAGPTVNFESYSRRGQSGMTWNSAYNQNTTDAVGEPRTTDLLFIDDQGQKTVVAVSSAAGALSFYTVTST